MPIRSKKASELLLWDFFQRDKKQVRCRCGILLKLNVKTLPAFGKAAQCQSSLVRLPRLERKRSPRMPNQTQP
jgi:hypothetical protein